VQHMHGHRLVDFDHFGGGMAGTIELARHRLHTVAPQKQPALRACRLVLGSQQLEQMRRQHHVAVLAAFALLDAGDHALAADVADLQRHHLGDAQSRPESHAQRRLVLEPWHCTGAPLPPGETVWLTVVGTPTLLAVR
jgi:hypothetical protein